MALAYRQCKKPGCTNLTKKTYCEEHEYLIKQQKAEHDKRFDQEKRDQEAKAFYDSADWRKVKELRLNQDKHLCYRCYMGKRIKPADVVHHVVPLEVDWNRRLDLKNLRSLCHYCHNYIHNTFDLFPNYIQPSLIPVTIICGPPGSGKSTYANKQKGPNDIVIDLDVIKSEISGLPIYQAGDEWLLPAITMRNELLYSLSKEKKYDKAWFIVRGAKYQDRQFWKEKLGDNAKVIMIHATLEQCIERIRRDERRSHQDVSHVHKWFKEFEPGTDYQVIW